MHLPRNFWISKAPAHPRAWTWPRAQRLRLRRIWVDPARPRGARAEPRRASADNRERPRALSDYAVTWLAAPR